MRFIKNIIDFIFPPICVCCKRPLNTENPLPFCSKCHASLNASKTKEPKNINDKNVERCYCLYRYSKYDVKRVISHTKTIFSDRYASFISKELKEELLKHNLLYKIDLITFAPRKKSSINLHGFDQGEELAKVLSKETSIPYEKCIMRKGKSSEQKFLKSKEREENVKNIFKIAKDANIKDKIVLIVDDVITTGATVKACAKILKENGAKLVFALSIAD